MLELFDPEFLEFRDSAIEYLGTKTLSPSSWIRFFYLIQDVEIGNNYHQSIAADLRLAVVFAGRPQFSKVQTGTMEHATVRKCPRSEFARFALRNPRKGIS